MIRIDYGGHQFNTGVPDSNGSYWYLTEWSGWAGSSLRQGVADPTSQHGGVLIESLLGTRTMTLTGLCKATSEAAYWTSLNNLAALSNNLYETRDLVVHETFPKFVKCVRGDTPETWEQGVGAFGFTLTFLCPDPLKYDITEQTMTVGAGGTATVANDGTFFTFPEVTTGGSVDMINNTIPGSRIRTAQNVPGGTIFDHKARTVMNGGTSHYSDLSSSVTWWPLAPGNNAIRNQGSQTATIRYRNAYL